jgi:MSHA biogenesis protein MshL
VSEVTEKVKKIDVSTTDTLDIPLALSTIRESDSIVSARSGQVIVIGGLMQNAVNDQRAGIPWLSDLPFVGGLFRHQKNSSKKSELVILLKPVVVENGDTWNHQIRQSHDTMGKMISHYANRNNRKSEVEAAAVTIPVE